MSSDDLESRCTCLPTGRSRSIVSLLLFKYNFRQRRTRSGSDDCDITFLRFTDLDIKINMFSVLLSNEQTVEAFEWLDLKRKHP